MKNTTINLTVALRPTSESLRTLEMLLPQLEQKPGRNAWRERDEKRLSGDSKKWRQS